MAGVLGGGLVTVITSRAASLLIVITGNVSAQLSLSCDFYQISVAALLQSVPVIH